MTNELQDNLNKSKEKLKILREEARKVRLDRENQVLEKDIFGKCETIVRVFSEDRMFLAPYNASYECGFGESRLKFFSTAEYYYVHRGTGYDCGILYTDSEGGPNKLVFSAEVSPYSEFTLWAYIPGREWEDHMENLYLKAREEIKKKTLETEIKETEREMNQLRNSLKVNFGIE